MKPSDIVKQHASEISETTQHFGLTKVRVFGSALHKTDTEGSDLDLLVDAPEGTTLLNLIGLQQALEDKFGIPVDVLTENELPNSFREKVLQEAQPL